MTNKQPRLAALHSLARSDVAAGARRGWGGLVTAALVYGEIRLLTGSIWPAVVLHVGGNVLIGALMEQKFFSLPGGADVFMSPGWSSVVSSVLFAAVGLWLYRRRLATVSTTIQKDSMPFDSSVDGVAD